VLVIMAGLPATDCVAGAVAALRERRGPGD